MDNDSVFNPLAKHNLGKSVVDALLESPALPLSGVGTFAGAGVYAIYYHGSFPSYKPLSTRNHKEAAYPIYVGKAIPKGGRKGTSTDASLDSTALSKRLQEHKTSIEAVDSLRIEDFSYRSLVVDDIWIALGETLVIQRFQPLWNQVVDGFGNHDPGAGRYGGMRPSWDELHPGRSWAAKCQRAKACKATGCCSCGCIHGQPEKINKRYWRHGMGTLIVEREALAQSVGFTDDSMIVYLDDGRSVSVPLAWYPRLGAGTKAERAHHELIGDGEGIHWPDLDEDVSVEGILAGRGSAESSDSLSRWLDARRASNQSR